MNNGEDRCFHFIDMRLQRTKHIMYHFGFFGLLLRNLSLGVLFAILMNLERYFNDPKYSDMQFLLYKREEEEPKQEDSKTDIEPERVLHVNRLIVASFSEYFHNLLYGEMKESKQQQVISFLLGTFYSLH